MRAVDLFAGASGASTGLRQAGIEVLYAANHWPLAVETHALNHPDTQHVCQDLRQADWTTLPDYDLLWASPACQGHSTNSQPRRRPKHDADRGTAWAVTDCVEATLPELFVVENVRQFADWQLFPEWCSTLNKLGYHLQQHVLSATAFGVPQLRNRLIVVGSRKPLALQLPAAPERPPAIGPLLEPTRRWLPFESAPTAGARERMLDVLRRRGGRRCLVQHVTDYGNGVGLDEPIRTITTKAQWVLVDQRGYRQLSLRELARAQGFDDTFRLPPGISVSDGKRLIGNAVPPPMACGVISAIQRVS